jgi:RNA-directed DNA polymerase
VSIQLDKTGDEFQAAFNSLESPRQVAELLDVRYDRLVYHLYRSPPRTRYVTFSIPKRSGGSRKISAPATAIKLLQRKLNQVLQAVYPGKPSAHGFCPRKSIVTNARGHSDKRFVFNLDLKDFFPSVNFGRVRGMFMAVPYQRNAAVATVLAQICCHDNALPQGAPTSPVVANMVCAKLDSLLQRLADRYKCTYTRYADDITFSTSRPSFPPAIACWLEAAEDRQLTVGDALRETIESNGFRINQAKVRLQTRDMRQEVTGLTVNRTPNVRRRFVRQIRAMLHAWDTFGIHEAQADLVEKYYKKHRSPGTDPPSFRSVLRGKIEFLGMVRGKQDHIYLRMLNRFLSLDRGYPLALPSSSHFADTRSAAVRRAEWAERYSHHIYHLEVSTKSGDITASGTAFLYRQGRFATCAHNMVGEVWILFPPEKRQRAVDIRLHRCHVDGIDIASFSVSDPTLFPKALIPIRSNLPERGEEVTAMGFASVPQRRPTLGVYPGTVETICANYKNTVRYIQVSVETAGGMSGAPLLDGRGNVVGIVSERTFEKTEGGVPARSFRHAVPISHLLETEHFLELDHC